MNKLVWTFQILVTLAFGLLGFQKVVMPIPDLIAMGMWWVEDFSAFQVRAIGALEVLGAIGMNAPHHFKFLPKVLGPLAAGGLALTMVGAIVTHITRGDPMTAAVINSLLLGMSAAVAKTRLAQMKNDAAPTSSEVGQTGLA